MYKSIFTVQTNLNSIIIQMWALYFPLYFLGKKEAKKSEATYVYVYDICRITNMWKQGFKKIYLKESPFTVHELEFSQMRKIAFCGWKMSTRITQTMNTTRS